MENWRDERDKSTTSSPSNRRTSVPGGHLARTGSGKIKYQQHLSMDNFWDEDATRNRRMSDWQNQKPMPALINSNLVRVYSGEDEEYLRRSLTDLDLLENTASDDNVRGFNEATVAEQLAKEAALENRECFAEDVIKVWDEISQFIINHIKAGYGVQIAGLCTITIQEERKAVVDTPYFKVRRSPLMVLSNQVARMYKLANFDEYTYNHQASSVPLNLTQIGHTLQVPRRIIEGVVTEVLQSFARAVVCDKKVEFPFSNIGKLQVKDRVAKMRFYDEFCKKSGLDTPLPNLNPPKELIPDYIKDHEAFISLPEASEAVGPTLQGHMTPLRKHIPSESFRSVFHLREVRSVHEGPLLVSTKMKANKDTLESVPEGSEEITTSDAELESPDSKNQLSIQPAQDEVYDYYDPILAQAEAAAEAEAEQEEVEGEFETEFRSLNIFGKPRQSLDPHPHDLDYGRFMESRKKSETSESEKVPERKSKDTRRQSSKSGKSKDHREQEQERKLHQPKYEAAPLYHRRSVTGKYEIDAINANPALFKETLAAHHYAITSKILGSEVVKEHLARRDRIRNPPLSYDDKRFSPPSPR